MRGLELLRRRVCTILERTSEQPPKRLMRHARGVIIARCRSLFNRPRQLADQPRPRAVPNRTRHRTHSRGSRGYGAGTATRTLRVST